MTTKRKWTKKQIDPNSQGEKLKLFRMRLGFRTQKELAKEMGVSTGTISQWETNINPVPGMALKLIEAIEKIKLLEQENKTKKEEYLSLLALRQGL